MIRLPDPQTKRILQTNRGAILGDLWSSFNINLLDNPGTFRVGGRLKKNTNTTDVSTLGVPWGFQFFDARVFAGAGTRIFKNSGINLTSTFTEDSSSGAVTTYDSALSDMLVFNNTLVATISSKLYSKAADSSGTGAWTDRGGSLQSTNHKLTFFKKFNRLYVTDNGFEIKSFDTSWAVTTSATAEDYHLFLGSNLATGGTISTIAASSDRVWIGIMRATSTGDSPLIGASVFEWDGVSSQITKEYKIPGTSGVLAILIENDYPVVLDTNGVLRKFSGNGFEEVGRLPLRRGQFLGNPYATAANDSRSLHPNGLALTPEKTILALICNRNLYQEGTTENVNENLPSGVWEWSEEHGFVHKHALSYMPIGSTAVSDYGQNRISKAGALSYAKIGSVNAVSDIICGVEYYTDATTTTSGIFVKAPFPTNDATYPEGQKYGYFVTSWIESQNLRDNWQKIALKYRKFLNSTDKIWLKYRITEADPTEISITWSSITPTQSTFTTSTNLTSYTGYEIEVLQGTASGKCGHISSVSGSGPYTVTLDESFVGGTGTAKARLQAWKKLIVPDERILEEVVAGISETVASSRIQIKCCMQFTGDGEIRELILINNVHTKLA